MQKYIPTKTLNGKKIRKPWINRKVKSQMRRRDKLFRRMKKTKNDSDIRKYKECKKALQKHERQAYWTYINGINEADDPEVDRPPKHRALTHLFGNGAGAHGIGKIRGVLT